MAKRKQWDVFLDNQEWFTFTIWARYYREALRIAPRFRKYYGQEHRTVTSVKRSPKC